MPQQNAAAVDGPRIAQIHKKGFMGPRKQLRIKKRLHLCNGLAQLIRSLAGVNRQAMVVALAIKNLIAV